MGDKEGCPVALWGVGGEQGLSPRAQTGSRSLTQTHSRLHTHLLTFTDTPTLGEALDGNLPLSLGLIVKPPCGARGKASCPPPHSCLQGAWESAAVPDLGDPGAQGLQEGRRPEADKQGDR